jgi:hypothetical protein
MQSPTCSECGKSVAEMCMEVLRQAQAEVQAEAEAEAIADEIAYMMETSFTPELDLFDLQHGLGW